MKGQANTETRLAAEICAGDECKGKPRSEGYPVSERSAHLRSGARNSWEHPVDPNSPGQQMWKRSASEYVKQSTQAWGGSERYYNAARDR